MIGLIVNIHNRCNERRCRCTQGKKFLTAKAGLVGTGDFGYCTHESRRGESKISKVIWTNVPLERVGYVDAFEELELVTVYYHSTLDKDRRYIKKPLLIRVKDGKQNYHWFENIGTYDNRRWWRIDQEAGSGCYPTEDSDYTNNTNLENKLTYIACRLHGLHGIKIDVADNHNIDCAICKANDPIKFIKRDTSEVFGYVKHVYSGSFSGKSVLIHNGNQVTIRRISSMRRGYYVQFQLDSDNVKNVNVYYWSGDLQKKSPLMIEIILNNLKSYWLENISKHEKTGTIRHDKWKVLGSEEINKLDGQGPYLKTRLDILNCVYNGTIQIKIGKQSCHETNHYLHRNRISYGYGEVFGTDPVLYSYRYKPSYLSNQQSFNISEITVLNKEQEFPENVLPMKEVKMLNAYVSPCDEDKPFLICIETGTNIGSKSSKSYAWYHRDTNGNDWKAYTGLTSVQPPEKVTGNLKSALDNARIPLQLKECHIETSAKGIKLDIIQTPLQGKNFCEYTDTSVETKKVFIFVTKTAETPIVNFFKNTHKPAIRNDKTFLLQQQLVDGSKFQSKIQSVKSFDVYFWEGDRKRPIIIEVDATREHVKRYYGKGNSVTSSWLHSGNEGRNLLESLDHWNCENNNAIPIELTEPTNLTRFSSTNKPSSCLKGNLVRSDKSPDLPPGAKDIYEAKAYQVENRKKISRLTYNYQPTDIVPPYEEEDPIVYLYYWKDDLGGSNKVPLLIEFIGTAEKLWYENIDKESTKWRKISKSVYVNFYSSDGHSTPELNETFTTKIHEVNCRIHEVVQVDISKKHDRYCHHGCNTSKIKVSKSKETINEYNIYDHEPVETNIHLTVSSILYYGKEQRVIGSSLNFPLKNVKKVTAYFPNCSGGAPVAIQIQLTGGERWLIKKYDNWEEVTDTYNKAKNDAATMKGLLDKVKDEIRACDRIYPQQNLSSSYGSLLSGDQGPSLPIALVQDINEDDRMALNNLVSEADIMDKEEKKEHSYDHGFFVLDEEEDNTLRKEHADHTLSSIINGYSGNSVIVAASSTDTIYSPIYSTSGSPNVTIDIKKNTEKATKTVYKIPSDKGKFVDLEKDIYPEDSNFYRYTHEATDEVPFTVEQVRYDDIPISNIKPDDPIYSYSVWYWKETVAAMRNPLLIEAEKEYDKVVYYASTGTGGVTWNITTSPTKPLQEEKLETQLDGLNCKLNKAVTMDLSSGTRDNGSYCCEEHKHGTKRVFVSKGSVEVKGKSSTPIPYFKHEINHGVALSSIKYYINGDTDNRKRITAKELTFPIQGSLSVYIFYCSENPVLIYVDSSQVNVRGWYKQNSDYSRPWIKVLNDLSTKTPDNIKKCDTEFNKLVGILNSFGCNNYQPCDDKSQSQTQVKLKQDSGLTIKLKNKPSSGDSTTTYEDTTDGKRVKITVTRSNDPTRSDFYKFTHAPTESFKLEEVQDDEGISITETKSISGKVGSVSAYYWKHETSKNPLLIEIQDSGGQNTYYRNNKNGQWSDYKLKSQTTGEPTKDELELLNCTINDVVQIDATRISYYNERYCHHGDLQQKIKVSDITDSSGKLGMYKAFTHQHSVGGKLIISSIKKGREDITPSDLKSILPLRDVNKVIVYFCRHDIRKTSEPLLVYVDSDSIKDPNHKWFKRPDSGTTWEPAGGLNGMNEHKYTKIIDILDTIQSTCKPPEVTIDIYERSTWVNYNYTDGSSSNYINVKKYSNKCNDPGGFYEYKHCLKSISDNYYTVKEFQYNGKSVTNGLARTKKVTQVSVYYWSTLEIPEHRNKSRPLLVKVVTKEPGQSSEDKYYENKGDQGETNWAPVGDISSSIEQELKLLNCKLNNAVVIDVSKYGTGVIYYDACDRKDLDSGHGERMTVSKDDTGTSLGSYEVYKHTLKNPTRGKFHVVGLKNAGIILTGIDVSYTNPILGVTEMRIYFCSQELEKPLLIYYRRIGSTSEHNWYKNEKTNDESGSWQVVTGGFIQSTYNDEGIQEVLDKLESKCKQGTPTTAITTDDTSITPLPDGPTEERADALGAIAPVATGFTVLTGLGSTSGTLAGTAATFFGGWKLYNRYKGDPWVRQI
ncbi:hypothetical protein BEWA_024540 [Theileria equi strain WA]|uniref:Uncharacterized protein n=1 Tax=Theileria equi strain WA TaxID=1537102 RepID=L0AVM9_THEEQ|nr:hypothetical protein BEWA_024540 [Theileria equi strain WA]AFZ79605.1 hypothetical protein BEWA_024540 [Theileria equi strain WA]|eukprot:XP_004829271.1 hypothetical protein BEWA_024540 [Theileria equi strain WA]